MEETFDATEKLCYLTKLYGVLTSGFEKRRSRGLFSTSTKQSCSGITNRRARLNFPLGW